MFRVTVPEQPLRLLPLDYDPFVPPECLHELEKAGRRIGLALHDIEMLGQDAGAIEKFLYELKQSGLDAAVTSAPWDVLEAKYQRRKKAAASA